MTSKIMIVDDSSMVATLHSGILRKAGFECSIAENGSVALELLLGSDYSLIITDINMPRMNGYELARRIRKTPGYEKIPIVMVSTEKQDIDVANAMEAGANLYIVKPISSDQLLSSVRSFIQSS